MKKVLFFLPIALGLMLSSSTCTNDYEEYNDGFIFQNESSDTLQLVISTEYPDKLYPIDAEATYHYVMPRSDVRIGNQSLGDWFRKNSVLQLFVYNHDVPLGVFQREYHAERARYELTEQSLKQQNWRVKYQPVSPSTSDNPSNNTDHE